MLEDRQGKRRVCSNRAGGSGKRNRVAPSAHSRMTQIMILAYLHDTAVSECKGVRLQRKMLLHRRHEDLICRGWTKHWLIHRRLRCWCLSLSSLGRDGGTLVGHVDFIIGARSLPTGRSGRCFNSSDSAIDRHNGCPRFGGQGSRRRDIVGSHIAAGAHLGRGVHREKAPPIVVLLQGDVELKVESLQQLSFTVVDIP